MPAFLLQLFWQSRRKRENRLKQNAQKQKTARLGGFLRKNICRVFARRCGRRCDSVRYCT